MGWYVADGGAGGFLESGGTVTLITTQYCIEPDAAGINTKGQIVGTCSIPGPTRGFILNPDGSFRFLAVPGASSTFLAGINDDGEVAGTYYSSNPPFKGAFVYSRGLFETIKTNACHDLDAHAISNNGRVAGECVDGPVGVGFVYGAKTGDFTTLRIQKRTISRLGG